MEADRPPGQNPCSDLPFKPRLAPSVTVKLCPVFLTPRVVLGQSIPATTGTFRPADSGTPARPPGSEMLGVETLHPRVFSHSPSETQQVLLGGIKRTGMALSRRSHSAPGPVEIPQQMISDCNESQILGVSNEVFQFKTI